MHIKLSTILFMAYNIKCNGIRFLFLLPFNNNSASSLGISNLAMHSRQSPHPHEIVYSHGAGFYIVLLSDLYLHVKFIC